MRQITLDSNGNFGTSRFLTSTPSQSHYDVFYTKNDNSRQAIDVLNQYRQLINEGKTEEAARLLERNVELLAGTIITAQEINLMQSAIGSLERYLLENVTNNQQIIFSDGQPLVAKNNDIWIKPMGGNNYSMQKAVVSSSGVISFVPIDLESEDFKSYVDNTFLTKNSASNTYVRKNIKINGKQLNGDITLTPSDIGEGVVPITRTINNHPLSSNVNITKADIGLGNVTNNRQMPIDGGEFTGVATAYTNNFAGAYIRNNVVVSSGNSPFVNQVSTSCIIFSRE